MNNELAKITALPSTKQAIGEFAQQLAIALDNGDIDPLVLLRQFKALEKVHELIKGSLDKAALKEAEKHPEKEVLLHGVKYTKKDVYTKYDYSVCNDSEWKLLKAYNEEYSFKLKKKEEFLKTLTKSIEIVDEDTSEIVKLNPPNKKSTSGLAVSFE